jgi:DNA polymerase III subunit gamma/tau
MTYKSLYRTYRPHSFETVVGQKHIVQTLQNAIKSGKLTHAYLFCGPRGTGKTTVAKLLAKSINCLNPEEAPCNRCDHCSSIQNGTHPDVIEIDAASNNGVDEIRDLIEKVKYSPIQSRYKVYIVDEVHMLSQGAFNALLKTLEEPPAHVIFILATTEPHKVLPTIISRCQRYDFVRVNQKDIQARIEEVLKQEKIQFDSEATRLISQLADGGVRDALSILEQVIAYSGEQLKTEHVNDIYGIATTQDKLKLINAIFDEDAAQLMKELDAINKKNVDIRRLTNDLMEIFKEAIVYAYTKDKKLLIKLSEAEAKKLNRISTDLILKMIEDLMDTSEKYRNASNINAYFEIGLLKLVSRLASKTPMAIEIKEEKQATKKKDPPIFDEPESVDMPIIEPVQVDHQEIITHIEEVKTEPLSIEPEENKEESRVFEDEFLLGLLVAADKEYRKSIGDQWHKFKTYATHPNFARLIPYIEKTELFAANKNFILVHDKNIANIVEINMNSIETLFSQLMEEVFGEAMHVYAITTAKKDQLIAEFLQLQKDNSLPEAPKLEKPKKKSNKKKEVVPLVEVMNLFGEDNVEII